MTTAALSWGCAFLAFGPCLSLLFIIAYQKEQLIIVVTTSAFAYLLAALSASFVWYMFYLMGIGDYAFLILFPGVIMQFLWRCAFVKLFHKVERVIEISIARHEEREEEFHESAKLRLELNDWACAIAAGTGFGGMHAIMLYGTLLASEAGNVGTLYQSSCPGIPSLVNSALNTFFFSLLDIVWMLLSFYGMGRRSLYARGVDGPPAPSRQWGAYIGNSRKGGNTALGVSLVTHLAAAFVTMFNNRYQGCQTSLPLLASIFIITLVLFWGGVSKIYLPDNQRRRLGQSGTFHNE